MVKLIVFGATGKSGKAILTKALEQKDLQVSTYVRSPNKLPDELRGKLNIIEGDVLNQEGVNKAISGHDVVLSALGRGKNLSHTTLISKGTLNVVEGMRVNNVKKLLVVTVSTELPVGGGNVPFFLKAVCDDHHRMLTELKKCDDIDWCAVCVPEIYELPYTGQYKTEINKRPGGLSVVALDLADFMVKCAVDEDQWAKYKQQMVGLTSTISYTDWMSTEQAKIMIGFLSVVVAVISFLVYSLYKLIF